MTLNAVGDIMIGGKVGQKISQQGADYLFDNVRTILSQADFTIGNLECPLSDRGEPFIQKDFVFRASPKCAKSLKEAGINIACLANNHILDYGPLALSDTISTLKEAGISYMGAGENLKEACTPLIFELKGLKIAFLAFTYASTAKRKKPGCCPCELKFIQEQIKFIRPNVDLVIVSIHHGVEYVDYPNRYIISLFRGTVDAGANLVLGHHPHVVQGLETYKDSLIAYSLGNFVSGFPDEGVRKECYQKTALAYFTDNPPDINDMRTTESFILQCKLNSKGVEDYKLISVRANKKFQPVIMDKNESQKFLKSIHEISQNFSNLDDPIWDDMDDLCRKCKEYSLKTISFDTIIKKLHHIRPRHIKMIPSYLRAKLRG